MSLFVFLWVVVALVVGFTMKRGGLCVYAAVREIVNKRSARLLMLFLGATVCATVAIVPLSWLFPDYFSLMPSHPELHPIITGGILLGIGASLNRGCFFGTFVQLTGGNLNYTGTLLGMVHGVALTWYLGLDKPRLILESSFGSASPVAWVVLSMLGVMVLLSLLRLWLIDRKPEQPGGLSRSAIMVWLGTGVGGGLLFSGVGSWDYASVISNTTLYTLGDTVPQPALLTVLCMIAMITGGVTAAVSKDNLRIRRPSLLPFTGCFTGGTLMGIASIIVPGGNDGILLVGIPSLALHSILSFTLMVLTMWLIIYLLWRD